MPLRILREDSLDAPVAAEGPPNIISVIRVIGVMSVCQQCAFSVVISAVSCSRHTSSFCRFVIDDRTRIAVCVAAWVKNETCDQCVSYGGMLWYTIVVCRHLGRRDIVAQRTQGLVVERLTRIHLSQ